MKRLLRKIFPHPYLTLLLAVVWIILMNSYTPGMAVFGLILGVLIPFVTAPWWPDTPKGFNLLKMIGYVLIVIWDILASNLRVAWLIVTVPADKLNSTWIVVPLDLVQPEAITILAGTITLTPGTMTADLSSEGHSLLVHVLHTDDPDAEVIKIKTRYEARLKEIFA